MSTSPNSEVTVPELLTVEEAAAVLRIGRTKAYALARQWRTSGGRSGLPVVDLGNVLRVPRAALERLVGTELRASAVIPLHRATPRSSSNAAASSKTTTPTPTPTPTATGSTSTVTDLGPQRSRRRHQSPTTQPSLFDPPAPGAS